MNIHYEASNGDFDWHRFYNSVSDEWLLPREGPFWEAVKGAHNDGHLGKKKRVAIIDSSFDLSIPRLNHQAGGATLLQGRSNEPKSHGTLVALLVSAVAPQCKLDLYEISRKGKPDIRLFKRALDLATDSEAQVVNLSLGAPRKFNMDELRDLEVEKNHCELCQLASKVAQSGKLVVAAVGNARKHLFCPARCKHVFGVGFHSEKRELKPALGGFKEVASWDHPSYSQAYRPSFTLTQPKGVLGSSFAAPLMSGLAAIIDEPLEMMAFNRSIQNTADAESLHSSLDENSPASIVELTEKLYRNALSLLPHQHNSDEVGPACVVCAALCHNLYINAGLFFLETNKFDEAVWLLRTANWLAPWSAHAAANLGRLYLTISEQMNTRDSEKVFNLLIQARDLYRKALLIKPGFEIYSEELQKINKLIELLRGNET